MKYRNIEALVACLALGIAFVAGCSSDGTSPSQAGADEPTGTVSMQLQLGVGVTVNAVNWTITNAGTGFALSGSVNEQFSNTVQFLIGGLPSGGGYTITLTATSVDGTISCAGSQSFAVTPGVMQPVNVTLTCSAAAADAGSVVITGTTQVCANITALSAAPLETAVNSSVALSATASAGSIAATFAWTATAGTFDNAASATPVFTCPATAGPVTVTVTASPSGPTCSTATSQSVTITCDTLNPTFTNVYTSIIGARCTSCHKPGSSGVTVGGLDMSTQTKAYANLVGVPAAGIGAGTSGITCASVSPALVRVTPTQAASSLLFNKVNSKVASTPPPCGSPMPLPATAAALTPAQVNLIRDWINAGAMND